MANNNIPGLFRATDRATIRNKPGKYVIGTLYGGEYFYAEHLHEKKLKDDWWVWGYTGGEFKNFGWVSRVHLESVAPNTRPEEEKYARRIQRFLANGGHRNRDVANWATMPLPTGEAAQGRVKVHKPIYLYGNSSCKRTLYKILPAPPGGKQRRLSWRYILKGRRTHLVVYHPTVFEDQPPVKYHGKWGFIKNDPSAITVIHNNGTQIK